MFKQWSPRDHVTLLCMCKVIITKISIPESVSKNYQYVLPILRFQNKLRNSTTYEVLKMACLCVTHLAIIYTCIWIINKLYQMWYMCIKDTWISYGAFLICATWQYHMWTTCKLKSFVLHATYFDCVSHKYLLFAGIYGLIKCFNIKENYAQHSLTTGKVIFGGFLI